MTTKRNKFSTWTDRQGRYHFPAMTIPRLEKLARAYNSNEKVNEKISDMYYAYKSNDRRIESRYVCYENLDMLMAIASGDLKYLKQTAEKIGYQPWVSYADNKIFTKLEDSIKRESYLTAAELEEMRGNTISALSLLEKQVEKSLTDCNPFDIHWSYKDLRKYSEKHQYQFSSDIIEKVKTSYQTLLDMTKKGLEERGYFVRSRDKKVHNLKTLRYLGKSLNLPTQEIDELEKKIEFSDQPEIDAWKKNPNLL